MYTIAIGSSSRSKLTFGVCIFLALLFAVLYGVALGKEGNLPPGSSWVASGSLVLLFLTHGLERYNAHVADEKPFWVF